MMNVARGVRKGGYVKGRFLANMPLPHFSEKEGTLATCFCPEPPKGVGNEGVGNSSTDLVSVQDWQPLLSP